MFQFDSYKMGSVRDMLDENRGIMGWRRCIRGGRSKEELESLIELTSNWKFSTKRDFWWCPRGPRDKFSVSWLKSKIRLKNQFTSGIDRWCKWVPKNVIFSYGDYLVIDSPLRRSLLKKDVI